VPVAFVSAVPAIPLSLGVPRVVRGVAITHVLGDPSLPPAREEDLRRGLLEAAVRALACEVSGPTLFEPARDRRAEPS
jgi:glycine reductase complex component B subunit gamma